MVFQWSPCVSGAAYTIAVDWENNGSFTDPNDDVTDDVLDEGVTVFYGRDQERQLSPSAVGRSAFVLCNAERIYSPENQFSPLFGDIGPARNVLVDVSYNGVTYPLARGRIDDFEIRPDRSDRSASITVLDGLVLLQGASLSTKVYQAQRTGTLIGVILDTIGWTGPRDIDPGATHVPWWWQENTNAFDAVQELVRSEGPPAIAYVAPDGTFTFRDRHHRLLRAPSLTSQATFSAPLVACDTPPVTGFDYTEPFIYEHGWRDIVNRVTLDVAERHPNDFISVVWESESTYNISNGETLVVNVSSVDPFIEAVTPVEGVDFTRLSGLATLTVTLTRDSGQSTLIQIMASGGTATLTNLRLRARPVTVLRTVVVDSSDPTSITLHGERSYPDTIPWVGENDALAISSLILANYAGRRPRVSIRVVTQDPDHLTQVLSRTVSDRITIINGELGLSDDFFIESVSHTIRRINPDAGPVHAVVWGCERKMASPVVNPFTFDKVSAGFDDGFFGASGVDDPNLIFIFDHPIQGQFDLGQFAT